MKENITNKKIIEICILVVIVILLLVVTIFIFKPTNNAKKEQEYTSTTTPTTYHPTKKIFTSSKNSDYEEQSCSLPYYSGEMVVIENTLYAVIDEDNEYTQNLSTTREYKRNLYKLKDDIQSAEFLIMGQCDTNYALAIGKNNELYYINNFAESTDEPFKVTLIEEVKDIEKLESKVIENEDYTGIYATDKNGEMHEIHDLIIKYSKLN